ncbi:MAG: ATP-binding cassette domain-containing protein, partial [Clostridiales bacterium]|nr:ATP-binding cassette domain-containing protein [Clostridiales bacterium]
MESIINLRHISKTYRVREESEKPFLKRVFSKKSYRSVEAVKDVSLEIKPGEAVGLIGNNGAGKSTLIKMMTGILYPSAGEIDVLGRNPFEGRIKNNQNIGVVFGQRTQLKWDLSPMESYKLLKCIYDIDDKSYTKNIQFFTKIFDMESFLKNPVRTLSLGQRMK